MGYLRHGGLIVVILLLAAQLGQAQQSPGSSTGTISGAIVDARNQPVAGAQILGSAGQLLGTTAADGTFTVPAGSGRVQIVAAHFEPTSVNLEGPSPVHVLLELSLIHILDCQRRGAGLADRSL